MSIVVGFQCVDGIMLCADTQETVGQYLKRSQPKLFRREHAVFASATEDGDLADVLVDKLWSAMELKFSEGLDAMIQAAEDELTKQYLRLVPLYPSGVPGNTFLIGIWAARNKFELIKVNGPLLKRHVVLDAAGCGAILATYLTSRLLYIKSWLSQAVPVGIYMIDQVKQHVDGCGGETHVVTINSDDGAILFHPQEQIEPETMRLRRADEIARCIVGLTMGDFKSQEQFELLFEDTCKPLKELIKITPSDAQK